MDKRLIDADKVQSWIDIEFEKKFPGDCYGYADGRQSILDKLESKINDGSFNPDPIPLPTIKPGDPVRHKSNKERHTGRVRAVSTCGQGALVRWTYSDKDEQLNTEENVCDLEVSHD